MHKCYALLPASEKQFKRNVLHEKPLFLVLVKKLPAGKSDVCPVDFWNTNVRPRSDQPIQGERIRVEVFQKIIITDLFSNTETAVSTKLYLLCIHTARGT